MRNPFPQSKLVKIISIYTTEIMYTRPSGIVCIMYSSETRSFFIPPGLSHTPLALFISHKAEQLGPFYTLRVSPHPSGIVYIP
jgi:hypothetical protein